MTRPHTLTPYGRRWRIDAGDRAVVVDDLVGVRYLVTLLANPHVELLASDLTEAASLIARGTPRLRVLDELRAGGRSRLFADEAERARIAVGKAIRRAILRVIALDARLGEELLETIRTGRYCSYRPPDVSNEGVPLSKSPAHPPCPIKLWGSGRETLACRDQNPTLSRRAEGPLARGDRYRDALMRNVAGLWLGRGVLTPAANRRAVGE
ncbi:hypothetical protein [Tenggerimyces flavus]|uniref:Uncharacterized protein n=1 Tax=Tenggerimyces flavus TaxID=1708749 RepID=A0ABV7Y7E6_9ACTN|nr:hypothetical protein [Tenggerimyces flavus]MBM7785470.1 hypothetical protein [Tenggerimyces flavus]